MAATLSPYFAMSVLATLTVTGATTNRHLHRYEPNIASTGSAEAGRLATLAERTEAGHDGRLRAPGGARDWRRKRAGGRHATSIHSRSFNRQAAAKRFDAAALEGGHRVLP